MTVQRERRERLLGAIRLVRVLYQQLAATAEDGSPEQADYERGVLFYVDVERRAHLFGEEARDVVLREYPLLAEELSVLLRRRGERALSTRERELVVRRRRIALTPVAPRRREPGEHPRVWFLGGQPGAGKASLREVLRDRSGAPGTVVYDPVDDVEAHPLFAQIFADDHLAAARVAADDLDPALARACLEHIRSGPYDAVVVDPLGDLDGARRLVRPFAEAGYRVGVVLVAVHDSVSLLGLARRFQRGLAEQGFARWVDPEEHHRAYTALPAVVRGLEEDPAVHAVCVVDRDASVVHRNHRAADGAWAYPPGAAEALIAERDRPPTEAETARFHAELTALRSPSDDGGPEG
ncbi:zeta toxin family protein [Nocardiopsis sp. MG754419]|uniref:zeta toxin family protein n=1 Tax=Nocardiopsis sp. MG754419 TaxID=2259865 RepID=UPI001BA9EE6F|nr:zeta toxin family protein [Nocardiopsis sp. MG754419]MBR8740467.1 hypothetical protein [Nocardiopsis sp. MG754419]